MCIRRETEHESFALKFSEKSFKNTLKFFLGTVDIVSVRTKTLSDGERKNPREQTSKS